jgi:acetylornithine deacetylase
MDTLQILEKLVAFDTTSRNSNRPLVDWAANYLSEQGVSCEILLDVTGEKANLVARIGPAEVGGVVLCGHTDVVPVDGQPWTRPPFALTREAGRVYGRGTTDMKGFLASMLAAVPAFVDAESRRPLTIALTHDEEVGCLGAPALAGQLAAEPIPAAVVVGEPTSMRVARAHKGVRVLRTTVTGLDVHSSRTDLGASAIAGASRLVVAIEDLADELAAIGRRHDDFQPAHTTISVGTIAGGQALNIVPRECSFGWEYRWIPGQEVDAILKRVEDFGYAEVLPRLWGRAPNASVTTDILADVPALDPGTNGLAAALLCSLGLEASPSAVAFATDGSTLQQAGLPVVVCGPGSMAQGHQPDEFIEVSELDRCDQFMQRLAAWAALPEVGR